MEKVEYDPVKLIQCLDPLQFDDECMQVLQMMLAEIDQVSNTSALSPKAQNALETGIKKSLVSISNECDSIDHYEGFFSRAYCEYVMKSSKSQHEKENIMLQVLPDVPRLCELVDMQIDRLNTAIIENDNEIIDQATLICLQLLQLASLAELEEGARRHLCVTLKRLTSTITTPEDLVEVCLKTLHQMHAREDAFAQSVREVILELVRLSHTSLEPELETNFTLRILSVLGTCLESLTRYVPDQSMLSEWEALLIPCMSHANDIIRESSIVCLGKLGLLVNFDTVERQYKPLIHALMTNETEQESIRGQAMLVLSDWILQYEKITLDSSNQSSVMLLKEVVGDLLEGKQSTIVPVVAEIATKLLYNDMVQSSDWIARLLILFFDQGLIQSAEFEDISAESIGSPIRLQQHLSLFFPAYCNKTEKERCCMLNSISFLLEYSFLPSTKKNGKKRSRASSSIKPIEYICTVVEGGKEYVAESNTVANSISQDVFNSSVSAAYQIASFLLKEENALNLTQQRALCKFIGNVPIDTSFGIKESHKQLRHQLEELTMTISDPACLQSLESALAFLEGFQENNRPDDMIEVGEALKSLVIENENEGDEEVMPRGSSSTAKQKDNKPVRRVLRSRG
jgi:hypothetical protein